VLLVPVLSLTTRVAAYQTFCCRTLPHLQEGRAGGQGLVWSCGQCAKASCHKMQMMKHVESAHLKTNDPSYGYYCDLCPEFCLSYNLLSKHKRVAHKSHDVFGPS
jgi:hypothetical protein